MQCKLDGWMDGYNHEPIAMQTCRVSVCPLAVIDQLHQQCMSWLQLSVNHARLLSLSMMNYPIVSPTRRMRHAVHNCKDSFRWVLHTFIVLPYSSSPCRLQADMHGAGLEILLVWCGGRGSQTRRLLKLDQTKWKQMCASKSRMASVVRFMAFISQRSTVMQTTMYNSL